MGFLKWLHRRVPAKPSRSHDEATSESGSILANEINLATNPVLSDAVSCARHAIVMEFRETNRFDPSADDLAEWARPLWPDRQRVRTIIQARNRMALSLGERFPDFWEHLRQQLFHEMKR